ncbi:MAG: oligosaccharide flippase family protein [Candidatus Neomarinimicrobiota bacterium]
MLNKIKMTVKHSGIYSLGGLLPKLIGYLLLRLYTSELGASGYGNFAIFDISLQIFVAVFLFSLPSAMMRWYIPEQDEEKRKSILFTTFSAILVTAILLSAILVPLRINLSQLFFQSDIYGRAFLILAVNIGLQMLGTYTLTYLRMRQRSLSYIILAVSKFTLVLALNIYFVAYRHMGIEGILLSQLAGNAFLFLYTLIFVVKEFNFKFNGPIFKEMMAYGFPLIFATLSVQLLRLSDKYIIFFMMDSTQTGIYNMGYKIASIVNVLVIHSFQLGFLPIAYKMIGQPGAKRFYSKMLTYYVLVLVMCSLVLVLFSKEMLMFVSPKDPEFMSAMKVIPILAIAFIFEGMRQLFAISFHIVKKTRYNAWITMVVAVFNVGLSILLVERFGYIGAAISVAFCVFLNMFLFYVFSQKVYSVPYEMKKVFTMVALLILITIFVPFLNELSMVLAIILKVIILFAYPFLLYLFQFYDPVELQRIKGSVKKWSKPSKWKKKS